MLVSGLRVLLRAMSMFFALGMVALAMMFGGRTMCLGSVVVMFGCLIVFVASHFVFLVVRSQPQPNHAPDNGSLASGDANENVFGRSRGNGSRVGTTTGGLYD